MLRCRRRGPRSCLPPATRAGDSAPSRVDRRSRFDSRRDRKSAARSRLPRPRGRRAQTAPACRADCRIARSRSRVPSRLAGSRCRTALSDRIARVSSLALASSRRRPAPTVLVYSAPSRRMPPRAARAPQSAAAAVAARTRNSPRWLQSLTAPMAKDRRMKRFLALAVLACALSCPALAKDPDIPFAEFRLDNGLRVIVHEDHKAPIVAVTIWYHVGSKNETPGRTGFAHLFEHLMFNGSENYDDEYFRPLEEVGATNMNGTTNTDRTNYFETVPTTALDLALWMESDRMGHLLGAIDQKKLDEQRGVVQNEKREDDNQPYGKVFEQIVANLFPPGHPYSWDTIGSMADLNAATLDDVKRWFQTYYGPNNATLVLAGDIDVETAKTKVQHFFGDIPPGPPLVVRERWIPDSVPASRIVMQDRVPQARIYKVWRGPEWRSDDTTLLELVDAVLTSGKSSRLYQRLVYDNPIATDVGAC